MQRAGTALLATAFFLTMLVYYALVLVGLEYWGRVISWELVASYATQMPVLADTLGISLPLAVGAVALVFSAMLAAAWLYAGRFDWAPTVARRVSRPVLWVALPAATLAVTVGFYNFLAMPPTRFNEPVSLTLFPLEQAWAFQGQAVDRLSAARLDRLADAARSAYVPSAGSERMNVVLIVADALRPDHMGVHGYARDTTPNLSRLARSGAVRKAPAVHAVCASSSCGLVGLASSKFVHEFHPGAFTLHEVLKRHGYRVHFVLSGDHTSFYGLKLAYGEADSYFDGSQARGHYMNDDRILLDRLNGFADWDGKPVMFHFHLMSAHVLGKRDAAAGRFHPAANYAGPEGRRENGAPGINFYDNGVLQADAMIDQLLQTLQLKGYLRSAIVAITADHGESLGEEGLYTHSNSVREPALRIPFLIVSYGHQPVGRIDRHAFASQVDIAPTILAELGLPQPATWSGVPLQSAAMRDLTYFQERFNIGLIDHRDPRSVWKYWTDSATRREYAFDLTVDPQERTNAVDRVPPERLREWRLAALIGAKVDRTPRPD